MVENANTSFLYSGDQNLINNKGANLGNHSKPSELLSNLPDVLSTPTNTLINSEINPRMWPTNSTDDDLRLLDGFLSSTTNGISTNSTQSLDNLIKQQNNNSSHNDEKQLIGPLGSNLYVFERIFNQ
jgi:hypothetical protein